jgi:hypothetical protein
MMLGAFIETLLNCRCKRAARDIQVLAYAQPQFFDADQGIDNGFIANVVVA